MIYPPIPTPIPERTNISTIPQITHKRISLSIPELGSPFSRSWFLFWNGINYKTLNTYTNNSLFRS